jgi:exopolysaccharide biosynthesis WecB/TagA/CpsF family protein
MDNAAIVCEINQSGADILLVALGHPKQDRWIAMHRDELRVSVAVGVGCCLDLIAGRVKRAPTWMQKLGLEWLFRAMQEPRRLARRYAVDLGSLGFFLLPALLHRFRDVG